jgi:hypothetical protein
MDVNFLQRHDGADDWRVVVAACGARRVAYGLLAMGFVFWLGARWEAVSLEELVPQLEALGRVASELDARLARVGMGGIEGAAALHERIRAVVDAVSRDDLERMTRQVEHMQRELGEIARGLAALRDLKTLLDGVPS